MRTQGERGREKEGGRERGREGEGHYREIKSAHRLIFATFGFPFGAVFSFVCFIGLFVF